MKDSSRRVLWGPLSVSLGGALFCFWATLGHELSLCVTAGCKLFLDASVGGISLWYYGMGAFMVLSVAAVSGMGRLGSVLAGLCLLGDVGLLALMAMSAPCVSCLAVALIFAVTYATFRKTHITGGQSSTSWLLLAWALLWLINISAVGQAYLGSWAMQGDPEQAGIHVYFSPSCPSCQKALYALSGNIEAAFYPVVEKDEDVAYVAHMLRLQQQGLNLATAHEQAMRQAQSISGWKIWSPDIMLLRFRMLRNKAHIFISGANAVPFLEYRGIPAHVAQIADAKELARLRHEAEEAMRGIGATPLYTPRSEDRSKNAEKPMQDSIGGSCYGAAPCSE